MQDEMRENCKDRSDFKYACGLMAAAGKKIDAFEKRLMDEMADGIKTGNLSN